ncbi:MAG: hypothetical protein ACLQB1_02100 [Streptosporangiaceae bacterium]
MGDIVRLPVNRQITMRDASASIADPAAQPVSEIDPDRAPATDPRAPSLAIHASDTHASSRAVRARACQAASRPAVPARAGPSQPAGPVVAAGACGLPG